MTEAERRVMGNRLAAWVAGFLVLALALPWAASPAFATSCLEKTWELRASAPNHAHMSPGLDRESAAYQCHVTGTRGQASAYLHAVETLTQRRAGYCLPWAMALKKSAIGLSKSILMLGIMDIRWI